MPVKPQKLATFRYFGFVIDINEHLYYWQLHGNPINLSKVFEEDEVLFHSIVVGNNSLVLLDVNNCIWRYDFSYPDFGYKIEEIKTKFKKWDCPLDVQSIGLSFNTILSIFTTDGKVYTETNGEVIEVLDLPPLEYFSTHSISAGVDFQGDIWYWETGISKPKKISTNGAPLDMIVEGDSVKYIDSEGIIWKYNTSEDVLRNLFSDQNLPPFCNLYGAGKHGFALSQKDELYGWGNNSSKQLGIKPFYVSVPTLIPTDRFWTSIYCGSENCSLLIADDGELFCWGNSSDKSLQIKGIICRKKMLQKSARK